MAVDVLRLNLMLKVSPSTAVMMKVSAPRSVTALDAGGFGSGLELDWSLSSPPPHAVKARDRASVRPLRANFVFIGLREETSHEAAQAY